MTSFVVFANIIIYDIHISDIFLNYLYNVIRLLLEIYEMGELKNWLNGTFHFSHR